MSLEGDQFVRKLKFYEQLHIAENKTSEALISIPFCDLIGRELSKTRDSSTTKKTMQNSKQSQPIYIDLAYIPHYGNPYYTSLEFFKRIRARYYVLSGTDPSKEVLNALLEAKKLWDLSLIHISEPTRPY